MPDIIALAVANLTSPVILFFVLGLGASLARSDLTVPEAIAKGMSLYLLLAIGFKGGAGVAAHGVDATLIAALIAGVALSAALPLIAFRLLRATSGLSRIDAAAVAGHYGSISIVTFLAATQALADSGIAAEPYMVAVAAAMETPAIIAALWLAASPGGGGSQGGSSKDPAALREIFLNGSIVMLIGSFAIGLIAGEAGMTRVAPFIVEPFQGVLCLFLLDMGLIAGRGLRSARQHLSPSVIAFGAYMPLIGAVLGLASGAAIGLSPGGTALLATLSASASYIAVPAAMRLALPDANPSIYLPLSLGVTFPFNLAIGIPIYIVLAESLV